ncbi:MAG: HEAT repeat domain-containing protein [Elusimicrobia bacterium]|nr:HEAT repeat domain-containing protein [Elusimicrobiota bacterium]
MRKVILALVFLAAAPGARAQSTATLRGIDVYRSAVLSQPDAVRLFGPGLREYVSLKNAGTPGARAKAEAKRLELQKAAAAIPGIAFAELHVTEYFTSVDHAMYAVFDVVDAADASRLAFTPAPKAHLKDPDGLLEAWRRYVALGESISRRGDMPIDRPACPGIYCLWGGTPELDAAQKAFVDGAVKQSAELRRILRADADGEARASALFVLSYSPTGSDVVALCQEALNDSDERVRGAALQILADVANHRPDLHVALDRVLPRLDDPAAAERGKAMGLLVPLAEKDADRQVMMSAAPRLAALLKLAQPESRDLAYTLLGIISKKNYDKQDFASWDAWAAKAAAR